MTQFCGAAATWPGKSFEKQKPKKKEPEREPHRHDASSSWGMGSSARAMILGEILNHSEFMIIVENLFRFPE